MIKTLLTRAIQQKNVFMTTDMLQLQIEFFTTAGKITETDKIELVGMIETGEIVSAETSAIEDLLLAELGV